MCCNSRFTSLSKKNFEVAEKNNIGLVIQIKGNQESLFNQVEYGCKRTKALNILEDPISKAHGRIEERKYEIFDTCDILKKWPEWKNVKRIIRVTRKRERLSVKSVPEYEISYYGSNKEFSAKIFSKLIRDHWLCENKNHYVKDTAFKEDSSTKRIGAFNYSILLSYALNIFRINGSTNIRGDIYLNTMNFDRMMNMVNYL